MLVRKIAVTLCRNLCCKKTMSEWMDEFNECVISRPTAIQGMSLNIMIAGSAARRWLFCLWVREPWCEWKSEPDDKNYIAQVVRYLLLSSIIMTAGASLHTSVNQHAQRHWCITPVVWRRHQKLHKYSDTYYLLLSSIIMTAGASLHTSVNQHAQRHWCITPVVWQRHQDTHRSAIRPHTEAKWHRHMRDWTKRY